MPQHILPAALSASEHPTNIPVPLVILPASLTSLSTLTSSQASFYPSPSSQHPLGASKDPPGIPDIPECRPASSASFQTRRPPSIPSASRPPSIPEHPFIPRVLPASLSAASSHPPSISIPSSSQASPSSQHP
nr:UBA-like domain-containing protein 1 [Penaeus vannamei]